MTVKNLFDISGKKALVTGAGRGIGKVLAIALAEAGCDVAVLEIDKKTAEETAAEIKKMGRKSVGIAVDVTKKDQIDSAFAKTVKELNGLDICLNNAGICFHVAAEEMTEADCDRELDVNLKGVFLCSQAASKTMIPQKSGSIISIASMSATAVNVPQKQAIYNASKAGVAMLTKCLAYEWAQYGSRVHSISPGYIKTQMTLATMTKNFPLWESLTPIGRLGIPEDLRGAVIYLASEGSSFVTGHDLIVDGGYTIR
ncbi:MAG TPA: SDR family oxidoreductase [Dehalococcoidales bacterium]|nr:SDR family oxidoreductase [Dehalococcoidales bacterium]